ncbi:hypothetical protein PPERSA_03185 [Pseudocohnilembus persalinus]|uniref:Uncharacterized protein n=1 Tax=Pseudocohnilembus persalinus TaxID=266149 RepID=A0A0V0QE29_PSEPJ|nr:hypothetical protein PPERSA_03185 [Pseudocohnilembus persalinus]|eukprot:KRX00452.1 hypothetical protein PPERSA_03185 [Pseudocohnilembus persalinus]
MQKIKITDPLKCKKQDHNESPIQYFNFSNEIDELFQCIYCVQEYQNNHNKIVLDQLFSQPVWKIRNFPPLHDQELGKKIRKIIELNQEENLNQFQQEILQKIEKIYFKTEEEVVKSLHQLKKETIQTYQDVFLQMRFQLSYDIEPLKEMIYKYSKNEINLEKLFQQQLEMKEDFVSPIKLYNTQKQEIKTQVIQKQLEQLENDLKNFKQTLESTVFNESLQQLEAFNKQSELKFYKSNYNSQFFPLQEITISNQINNNNINTILHFDDKTIDQKKQVYSQVLDKFKTHHIKMKINFNGNNKQIIRFAILDSQNKDSGYCGQNNILITDISGKCESNNGISFDKQGQDFSSFMQNDKTIFNIVINYSKKLFQIYDDEKICYINHVINQDLIKEDMLLGIRCFQNHKFPAKFTVLEYFTY